FVYPSHRAIELARMEGFQASMSPAVSAEDCLFADLGVDPASAGCQSYEATNFLIRQRLIDPYASLVLWQIGVIGDRGVRDPETYNREGIDALIETLSQIYGPNHSSIVYLAAEWPIGASYIQPIPLARLHDAEITPLSTLYVPPKPQPPLDEEMIRRLN